MIFIYFKQSNIIINEACNLFHFIKYIMYKRYDIKHHNIFCLKLIFSLFAFALPEHIQAICNPQSLLKNRLNVFQINKFISKQV